MKEHWEVDLTEPSVPWVAGTPRLFLHPHLWSGACCPPPAQPHTVIMYPLINTNTPSYLFMIK